MRLFGIGGRIKRTNEIDLVVKFDLYQVIVSARLEPIDTDKYKHNNLYTRQNKYELDTTILTAVKNAATGLTGGGGYGSFSAHMKTVEASRNIC